MRILACCLLATWASAATAGVIVDQEYAVPPGIGDLQYFLDYPGDHMAQTFTVAHSGKLTGVGVQVSLTVSPLLLRPPIDDLHVKVVRTDPAGFALISDVLAEGTISYLDLPLDHPFEPAQITDVDLTSWHAQVTAGEKLAIALSSAQTNHSGPSSGANYLLWWALYNPHPGGEFSVYSPQLYGPTPLRDWLRNHPNPTVDTGFRVYVNVVAEPATGGALVALASCLRLAQRGLNASPTRRRDGAG